MRKQKKKENKYKELSLGGKLFDLLKNISKLQCSEFFRVPVDAQKYNCPNYYEVIKNPMDLLTMKNNLLLGKYQKLFHFENDFNLIVTNCKYYNPNADNPVRKALERLELSFYNKYDKIKELHSQDQEVLTEGLKEMEMREIEFQRKKMDGLMGVDVERKRVKDEGGVARITINLQSMKEDDEVYHDSKFSINLGQSYIVGQTQQYIVDKQQPVLSTNINFQSTFQQQTDDVYQQNPDDLYQQNRDNSYQYQSNQQSHDLIYSNQQNSQNNIQYQPSNHDNNSTTNNHNSNDDNHKNKNNSNGKSNNLNSNKSMQQQIISKQKQQKTGQDEQNEIFKLDIKQIKQSSYESYFKRIRHYRQLIKRKTGQLHEFLVSIQDNFDSLSYLVEKSKKVNRKGSMSSSMSMNEKEEDELEQVWIICYELAVWFNQYRSNLDVFNSKQNSKQFYQNINILGNSLKKVLKYSLKVDEPVYQFDRNNFNQEVQCFQEILDNEHKQNNIRLSIPQEIRQQMNKQYSKYVYQEKFNKQLKYIEERNRNKKVMMEQLVNQQTIIDSNRSKLTQSIFECNQNVNGFKNKLYMKIHNKEVNQVQKVHQDIEQHVDHVVQYDCQPIQLQINKVDTHKQGKRVDWDYQSHYDDYQSNYNNNNNNNYSNNHSNNNNNKNNNNNDDKYDGPIEYMNQDLLGLKYYNKVIIKKVKEIVIPKHIMEQIKQYRLVIKGYKLTKLIFSSLFNNPLSEEQQQKLLNALKETHKEAKMFFKEKIIKEKRREVKVNQMVNVKMDEEWREKMGEKGGQKMELGIKNIVGLDTYKQFGSFKSQARYYEQLLGSFGDQLLDIHKQDYLYIAVVLNSLGNQFNSFHYDGQLGVYYCFDLVRNNQAVELQLTFCACYDDMNKLEIRFNDFLIYTP